MRERTATGISSKRLLGALLHELGSIGSKHVPGIEQTDQLRAILARDNRHPALVAHARALGCGFELRELGTRLAQLLHEVAS